MLSILPIGRPVSFILESVCLNNYFSLLKCLLDADMTWNAWCWLDMQILMH